MSKETVNPDANADNIMKSKRVLILGANSEVLQKVIDQVKEMGVQAEGTTDVQNASDRFNAKDFDLIVFGSGVVGPIS